MISFTRGGRVGKTSCNRYMPLGHLLSFGKIVSRYTKEVKGCTKLVLNLDELVKDCVLTQQSRDAPTRRDGKRWSRNIRGSCGKGRGLIFTPAPPP